MHAMDIRYFLTFFNENLTYKLDEFTSFLVRIKRNFHIDILDVYYQRIDSPYKQTERTAALDLKIYSIAEHPGALDSAHQSIVDYFQNELLVDKLIYQDLSNVTKPLTDEAESFWTKKYSSPDIPYNEKPASESSSDNNCDENTINALFEQDDNDENLPASPINDEFIDAPNGMDALESMTGLNNIKTTIKGILATEKFNIKRQHENLPKIRTNMHMCFMGTPGTAKTTVARLLSRIFYENGIIKNNVFVECGRGDLVGKYIGETALKVKKRFQQAEGGILFIDEAYSLVSGAKNDFGSEAISTIVQEMENKRNSVIVIFAGYPDKMEEFLNENAGLRSRIAYTLSFEDYSNEELLAIFKHMAATKELICDTAVSEQVTKIITQAKIQKNFGNGRFVRSLLEQACSNMALRLENNDSYTKEELCQLKVSDFEGLYKEVPVKKQENVISFKLK